MEFKGIKSTPSSSTKKYIAVFENKEGKKKEVQFGLKTGSQYPIHKNLQTRNAYISRHWKDLDTQDPTKAGFLSLYILWNKPNLNDSLTDYKRRYNQFLKTGKFPVFINDMNNNLMENIPNGILIK